MSRTNKGHDGHDARIRRWVANGFSNQEIAELLGWTLQKAATRVAQLRLRKPSQREGERKKKREAAFAGVPTINLALHKEPDPAAAAAGESDIAAAMRALRERDLERLRGQVVPRRLASAVYEERAMSALRNFPTCDEPLTHPCHVADRRATENPLSPRQDAVPSRRAESPAEWRRTPESIGGGEELSMGAETQRDLHRTFLRVFQPPVEEVTHDDSAPLISAAMTLPEFFEAAYVPLKMGTLHADTVQLMRDSVNHWKRLTENLPLWGIDDFAAADFVTELQQLRGRKSEFLSAQTVRRHCNSIQAILDFAGPSDRDSRNRKRANQSLITDVPFLDKPAADIDPPDGDFTLDELSAMLAAAPQMSRPSLPGVTPSAWWQAFLTVAYFTGLRVGALMRITYDDVRDGRLFVRAGISKKRKGRRQYLTAQALAAIESIRTDRSRIFQLPSQPTKKHPIAPESGWDTNKRWFLELFKRLQAAAGIAKERRFGFHGLRKLHATAIASADDKDGITNAQLSLGHSSDSTTTRSYVNYTVVERKQARAAEGLPDPRSQKKKSDDTQRRLFE